MRRAPARSPEACPKLAGDAAAGRGPRVYRVLRAIKRDCTISRWMSAFRKFAGWPLTTDWPIRAPYRVPYNG